MCSHRAKPAGLPAFARDPGLCETSTCLQMLADAAVRFDRVANESAAGDVEGTVTSLEGRHDAGEHVSRLPAKY